MYDLFINRKTGDWLFNSVGDIMGVTGVEFDRQRIFVRAVIPRGTFTYDKDKTLGSTLYQIPRNPPARQVEAARSGLYTALEGIDGINIDGIEGVVDEAARKISLEVSFSQVGGLEDQQVFDFELSTGVEGPEF